MRLVWILLTSALNSLLYANTVVPEDVLDADEITEIQTHKNYFLLNANSSRIEPSFDEYHKSFQRKYSRSFLKDRSEEYSYEQVQERVLHDGMNIHYKIEELYRARLEPHVALGKIFPSIKLSFTDFNLFSTNHAFNNLLGFLLPQNWLELGKAKQAYKVTQLLFLKLLMDESLNAENLFLKIHSLIQEFEIINFYSVHLDLLTRILKDDTTALKITKGRIASLGTKLISKRLELRLLLNQLALNMALMVDQSGSLSSEKLNIKSLNTIPNLEKQFADFVEKYPDKHSFIESSLNRSVEIMTTFEFYRIVRYELGVTAFGEFIGQTDDNGLSLSLSYGALPKILIAKSKKKTSELDVQSEYLKMVDWCRRAYDSYIESIHHYEQAKKSLDLNLEAFRHTLSTALETEHVHDGLFLSSLNQVLHAHLKENSALHETMMAYAVVQRLMGANQDQLIRYLPKTEIIHDSIKTFITSFQGDLNNDPLLDSLFRVTHSTKTFKLLLAGVWFDPEGHARNFEAEEIRAAVERNITYLLYRNWNVQKGPKFYTALKDYIVANQIALSPKHREILDHFNNGVWIYKFFLGKTNW